tara:strand:+ start:5042 stop:5458 length:417 start_codon:yes stop_codon:yes gene_type:complete
MEEYFSTLLLLTFFNGGLAITIVYYFIAIQKVKVAYEAMLASQSSLQNQQTIQNTMLREKADDLDMLILDIQSKMDEDNYADLSKINAKIKTLETVLESHARSWQMEQAFEKKVQESLANIKQWMKKMGDDPTLIRGY